MQSSYQTRREQLQTYFDRTANKAWEQLTSDAPVSKIRETVRQGRESMAGCLLSWLPKDLEGLHILDAGCGTGSLSIQAAQRGAHVTGVDISPSLIEIAKQRTPIELSARTQFSAGDMLMQSEQKFDAIVAMDSLIHYGADDMMDAIEQLAARLSDKPGSQLLFTFAPRTPLLMLMKKAGQWFPEGDRSPAIEPIAEAELCRMIDSKVNSHGCVITRTNRIDTRFYKSQALELIRQ